MSAQTPPEHDPHILLYLLCSYAARSDETKRTEEGPKRMSEGLDKMSEMINSDVRSLVEPVARIEEIQRVQFVLFKWNAFIRQHLCNFLSQIAPSYAWVCYIE